MDTAVAGGYGTLRPRESSQRRCPHAIQLAHENGVAVVKQKLPPSTRARTNKKITPILYIFTIGFELVKPLCKYII
jgi:hypothetical protein